MTILEKCKIINLLRYRDRHDLHLVLKNAARRDDRLVYFRQPILADIQKTSIQKAVYPLKFINHISQ